MNLTPDAIDRIASLADNAAAPRELSPGGYYVVTSRDGTLHQIDLTGDEWRDTPRRKTGTVVVRDTDSFLRYWDKHHEPGRSEVYADREALAVTAVIDAHGGEAGDTGWCQHRLALRLRLTESFKAWADISGRAMSQVAFAEFVEDHRPDVVAPTAAELMELAQTFQATTKATFRSQAILKSGQRELSYVEQIDATAGRDGKLTIPDKLDLALRVFDGAEVADAVTARLRHRIGSEGRLALIVILDQVRDVVDAAFQGVVDGVAEGVDVPILRGSPA